MPSLNDITRRRKAVHNTAKITQAMKMVSAAQLKRAQRAVESARPYVIKLEEMLANLVSAVGEDYSHRLIRHPKEIKTVAIVVVSSDRGLCGSFNTNLLRTVSDYLKVDFQKDYPGAEPIIIPVGKKSVNFFSKLKYKIGNKFPGIFIKLQFISAKNIVESFKDEFSDANIDKVLVFYNEFINVIKQKPTLKTLLPIDSGLVKSEGKQDKYNHDYIFEPDQKSILNELLPKLIDIQIWRTLLESNTAENAARMLAMDNATTNAHELMKYLELQFNKARQAKITKEMLEIVSGAEALKKS